MPALYPEYAPLGKRQRVVARYVTFVLVDLCVLNLFDEFTDLVDLHSFAISLLVAIVLQVTLKLSLAAKSALRNLFEHRILRLLAVWFVSFTSKFIIFWIVDLLFGAHVEIYGVKAMFALLIAILVTEIATMRLFWSRWLTGGAR